MRPRCKPTHVYTTKARPKRNRRPPQVIPQTIRERQEKQELLEGITVNAPPDGNRTTKNASLSYLTTQTVYAEIFNYAVGKHRRRVSEKDSDSDSEDDSDANNDRDMYLDAESNIESEEDVVVTPRSTSSPPDPLTMTDPSPNAVLSKKLLLEEIINYYTYDIVAFFNKYVHNRVPDKYVPLLAIASRILKPYFAPVDYKRIHPSETVDQAHVRIAKMMLPPLRLKPQHIQPFRKGFNEMCMLSTSRFMKYHVRTLPSGSYHERLLAWRDNLPPDYPTDELEHPVFHPDIRDALFLLLYRNTTAPLPENRFCKHDVTFRSGDIPLPFQSQILQMIQDSWANPNATFKLKRSDEIYCALDKYRMQAESFQFYVERLQFQSMFTMAFYPLVYIRNSRSGMGDYLEMPSMAEVETTPTIDNHRSFYSVDDSASE